MVPADSGRGNCTGDPAVSGGLRGATGNRHCVAEFLQWARSENGTARDEITEEDLVAIVSDFHSND